MIFAATGLVSVVVLLGGAGLPAPHAAPRVAATPEPLMSTWEGPALRVGSPGSEHFVGLLANGKGALADPAATADGLFRRDDADGVLGAVVLPGNTVCAVKRTDDGRVLPAGTVPY